jgi:hypothetical protein
VEFRLVHFNSSEFQSGSQSEIFENLVHFTLFSQVLQLKNSENARNSESLQVPVGDAPAFRVFSRRLSEFLMADGDVPLCSHGCKGCEGDVGDPTPGSKLCKKCACDYMRALEEPPVPECEPVFLLVARNLKLVVLKEDGDPIVDWAPIKSHALARVGFYRSGELLPKVPEDLDEAIRYPSKGEAEGKKRSYANACHAHTYAALVSFMKVKKKKPRGEELNPFLHATWARYINMSETVRALLPRPPVHTLMCEVPLCAGGARGRRG